MGRRKKYSGVLRGISSENMAGLPRYNPELLCRFLLNI
jgi:hypothetical protein